MQRLLFNVNTDTGTWGDTGPVLAAGMVQQIRWNPTTPDTGGDLQIAVLPRRGDTGDGWLIYNDNDCLGANFVRGLRQPQHGSDGAPDPADTGAAFGVPIHVGASRLRVKVIPGGAAAVGRLYIWVA